MEYPDGREHAHRLQQPRVPCTTKTSNVLSSEPSRAKPDLVASTEVATYTKWRWKCYRRAAGCDDLYFEGTSGATGQTGGITALVVGWFKKSFSSFTAANVADYLRSSAIDKGSSNEWGNGLVKLPCPTHHGGRGWRGGLLDLWALGGHGLCFRTRYRAAYPKIRLLHLQDWGGV